MKKYGIIGGIGLLVVVALAFVMFRQEMIDLPAPLEQITDSSTENRLSYVPVGFDQAVLMEIDEGLMTVMEQMDDAQTYTTGWQDALSQVDFLLATQYSTPAGYYSLLFVDAEQEVALSDIQELGLIVGGEQYASEQLSSNLWVYGTQESLAFFDEYDGEVVTDDAQLARNMGIVLDEEFNIGFISSPSATALGAQNNPLVQQFAQQLTYTTVRSHLDPEDTFGEVILQFTPGVVPDLATRFSPELAAVAPRDALVYLEIADLLGMFAIQQEQFVSLLPALLGQQNAAFGAALSSEQYSAIYNVLSNHISIALAPSTNMFGVSAEVSFAHPDAFALLDSLRPLWLGLASSVVGSGTLQQLEREEGFAYGISGLPMVGEQPVISLERDEQVARLTILGSGAGSRGIEDLQHSRDTVITFLVDSSGLQEQLSMTALSPLAPSVDSLEESAGSYLDGNILKGDVLLLPADNQLRINFTVVQ